MIQIVIIIFMGRWLYLLAKKHNKPNAWLYGLFAVLTYFGASFILGLIIGIILVVSGSDMMFTRGEELLITLMAVPFAIGAVALLHYILKRNWSREILGDKSILDESIEELDQ